MLRATDSEEEIAKRIQIAKEEVTHIPKYDYLVINDELEKAVQDVLAIIRAEENRFAVIATLRGFINMEKINDTRKNRNFSGKPI